jgi:hypothetical protein
MKQDPSLTDNYTRFINSSHDNDEDNFQIDATNNNPNKILNNGSTYISNATTRIQENTHVMQEQQALPYHKWEKVQALAKEHQEGLTFLHVQKRFKMGKNAAQNLLRTNEKYNKLFTSRRTKPQRYFLTKELANYHYVGSTHFSHTGVEASSGYLSFPSPSLSARLDNPANKYLSYPAHPPRPLSEATSLDHCKRLQKEGADAYLAAADTVQQALVRARHAHLGIHNIHLLLVLYNPRPEEDAPYERIPDTLLSTRGAEGTRNGTKRYEQRVGNKVVGYLFHPNNRAEVVIDCTEHPFPLDTQEHVTSFFCFLGGRLEVIQQLLCDVSAVYVPPVHDWYLTQADLNRDVQISARARHEYDIQYKSVGLQMREMEGMVRAYVKTVDGHFFYRREKTVPSRSAPPPYNERIRLGDPNNIYYLIANNSSTDGAAEERQREEAR